MRNFGSLINNYAAIYKSFVTSSGGIPQTPNSQLNKLYIRLQKQKKDLNQQIQSLTSSTERHNRDFVELEKVVVPNVSSVRVLDDYTLWTLMISYLLFACSIIFWYSHIHVYSLSAIAKSTAGMIAITFMLVVLAIIVL